MGSFAADFGAEVGMRRGLGLALNWRGFIVKGAQTQDGKAVLEETSKLQLVSDLQAGRCRMASEGAPADIQGLAPELSLE